MRLPFVVKVSLIMTIGKIKGRGPVATPAYIAVWWRDGTAAIEER